MSPEGELCVGTLSGAILRCKSPLATPVPDGMITGVGVSEPEELPFVDDELWIPTTDYESCSTTASKISRVAFNAAGVATAAGDVLDPGIVTGARGVYWRASTRTLYATDCTTVDTIQPFAVAASTPTRSFPRSSVTNAIPAP